MSYPELTVKANLELASFDYSWNGSPHKCPICEKNGTDVCGPPVVSSPSLLVGEAPK